MGYRPTLGTQASSEVRGPATAFALLPPRCLNNKLSLHSKLISELCSKLHLQLAHEGLGHREHGLDGGDHSGERSRIDVTETFRGSEVL
jgi:hypothetical protein